MIELLVVIAIIAILAALLLPAMIMRKRSTGIFVIGDIHWYDCLADRHNQGANLSFLDGHVEHHRWARPKPPPNWPATLPGPAGIDPEKTGDAPDYDWLAARIPVR